MLGLAIVVLDKTLTVTHKTSCRQTGLPAQNAEKADTEREDLLILSWCNWCIVKWISAGKKLFATVERTFRGPEQKDKRSAQSAKFCGSAKRRSHQWYCPPLRRGCQPRSRSKAIEDVPYAVGAMLAISAIASEVLAVKCNLVFKVF